MSKILFSATQMFSLSFLFLLCWLCLCLLWNTQTCHTECLLWWLSLPSSKYRNSTKNLALDYLLRTLSPLGIQVAKNIWFLLKKCKNANPPCVEQKVQIATVQGVLASEWERQFLNILQIFLFWIYLNLHNMFRRPGPSHMLLHTKLTWISFPLWNPSPSPLRLWTHQRYHLCRSATYLFLHSGPKENGSSNSKRARARGMSKGRSKRAKSRHGSYWERRLSNGTIIFWHIIASKLV